MEQPLALSADTLWTEVSGRLQEALNESTYSTWFGETEGAELDGNVFVLTVPNDFTREWIENHFRGLVEAAVRDVLSEERQVEIAVRPTEPAAWELEPVRWSGPVDGKVGVLLMSGRVDVRNDAGSVVLHKKRLATMVSDRATPPEKAVSWPAEKVKQALLTVSFK